MAVSGHEKFEVVHYLCSHNKELQRKHRIVYSLIATATNTQLNVVSYISKIQLVVYYQCCVLTG